MWTNVPAWDKQHWMGAASSESAAAPLRAGFLFFWYPISERTLAALFMWAHRGWGLGPYNQRTPVDASSIHVLSTAIWQHVLAQLRQQDERPIEQLAVEAHLCVTQRLLGNFPQYDGEISPPKFCQDCLWQHLAHCVARRPHGHAFQWFVDHQPEQFACTKHLEELNKILKRLEDPTPKVDAVEGEPSRLEVGSSLLKFKPWVFPVQAHLLLSIVTLTGVGIAAVLPSSPPESRVALLTEPLQPLASPQPVELSFLEPARPQQPPTPRTETPPPAEQPGGKPPPPLEKTHAPAPLPSPPPTDPTVTVKNGSQEAPVMPGVGENGTGTGTGTGSGSGSGKGGTASTSGGTPPVAAGSESEMSELAQRLSVQLQGLGRPCIAAGRRFEPVPGGGLRIDGRLPTAADITAIKIALKECK